ncbi:hypothetical protein L6164_024788 [Bauhinia variegata]|uniref:Uncharacterized protein n=1 Tax=Bauhinia variegata TaxID=167791 RepID=A0ACB9LYX1_BAUVA|nr:hypothetical protein L6164_024788 [Bauhinia variegata]
MESSNPHDLHHPLQDQPAPVDTATSLSAYGVGSSHSWTPNITLNAVNLNQNLQESGARSRASTQDNDIQALSLNGSMIQHLGYLWGSSDGESCISSSQRNHDIDLQFSKIKEEISSETFPKFTEILNSPSCMEHYRAAPTTSHIKNESKDFNALSEKLLLKTLSSGGDFYSTGNYGMGVGVPSRGSFSQIYPSINISNLNQSSPAAISSSLDINMQSLDLLSSPRFNGGLMSQRSQDGLGLGTFTDNLSSHMQQRHPTDRSSSNPSHLINGTAETKRSSPLIESKASQSQAVSKKSRLESRASCPPFKVRKEKLGDRIAALQQLVAPFGKTDTASVLMEAIGYIKFLQNQVETLSVPYMRSSRNQTTRVMRGGPGIEDAKEEPKQDLRSRGLCLVPLSCMSYITGDGGTGVWQQPDFGGAT